MHVVESITDASLQPGNEAFLLCTNRQAMMLQLDAFNETLAVLLIFCLICSNVSLSGSHLVESITQHCRRALMQS